MTNKERKSMIEHWVTEINPRLFFGQRMPGVEQNMLSMWLNNQESLAKKLQTICRWSIWNSTF